MTNIKSIYLIIVSSILIGLSFSCDRIPEKDRLIPVENKQIDGRRTILLEDFTGVNCVNCPKAAEAIHEIQNLFKGNVVAVGLHGHTGFTPEDSPLFSKEAQAYYNRFAAGAPLPAGMINRVPQAGSSSIINTTYTGWSGIIAALIEGNKQIFSIKAYAKTPDDIEQVSATITVKAVAKDAPKNLKLQVWVIENNIEGQPQAGVEGGEPYVHQHVLRGALNGEWGQDLTLDQEVNCPAKSFSKIDDIANCKVVAFVYDAKTMEVYEATEVAITK